jgi:hypothetical protein
MKRAGSKRPKSGVVKIGRGNVYKYNRPISFELWQRSLLTHFLPLIKCSQNTVLISSASGRVKCYIRIRPLNDDELEREDENAVDVSEDRKEVSLGKLTVPW